MIYFDLDGVIRNLCIPVFGREALYWFEKTKCGKNLIEYICANPEVLYDAPIMEYEEVFHFLLKNEAPVQIMTAQVAQWIPYTLHWLHKNLPYVDIEKHLLFAERAEDKLDYLKPLDILIDDHPKYESHPQVITVDHLYNRNIVASHRVCSKDELWKILLTMWRKEDKE